MSESDTNSPLVCEAYFPTLVFYRDLPGAGDTNPRMAEAIRAERRAGAEGEERSNVRALGGWHSRNNLHEIEAFASVVEAIGHAAREIEDRLGYHPEMELALDTMWAIVNPPGSFNTSHVHPGAIWSGVYYVRAPEGSGRIVFRDPRTEHLMMNVRYDPDGPSGPTNWIDVYFEPIEGRVILFPSSLYHSVEPNLSPLPGEEGERICLSFNLYQRRRRPAEG